MILSKAELHHKQRRRRLLTTESNDVTIASHIVANRSCSCPAVVVMAVGILIATVSPVTVASHGRIPFASRLSLLQHHTLDNPSSWISTLHSRGGATLAAKVAEEEDDDDEVAQVQLPEDHDEESSSVEVEDTIRQHPDFAKLQAYRMQQQVLLQLRATMLSEALARRGLPLPSLADVTTPEGVAAPIQVDWECAISTKEKPIQCIFTFDNEPGTKLIAPVDPKRGEALDTEWISVAALNRLRRNDQTKVQTTWHHKYDILASWFQADSEYSVLQHVGPKGILLNVLLDNTVLGIVVGGALLMSFLVLLPLLEVVVNRFLVSGFLWMRWFSWYRYVRMGLPIKLVLAQWLLSTALQGFNKIKGIVKDHLVELECEILDESLPITLGVPTPIHVEEGDAAILEDEEEILEQLVVTSLEEDDDDEDDDDDDNSSEED
jgi:hypothetical protein